MDADEIRIGQITFGQVVALDGGAKKDELADSLRKMRAMLPGYLANLALLAQMQRAKYLELVKQGFTEAQALELCKTL